MGSKSIEQTFRSYYNKGSKSIEQTPRPYGLGVCSIEPHLCTCTFKIKLINDDCLHVPWSRL